MSRAALHGIIRSRPGSQVPVAERPASLTGELADQRQQFPFASIVARRELIGVSATT